jgi:hypothetical protein
MHPTTIHLPYHSDSTGIGYLQVPKRIVKTLGSEVCNAISFFSYQNTESLFLESLDDMPLVKTALEKAGWKLEIKNLPKSLNLDHIKRFRKVNC